ncbi:hypothetical protein, partial [Brevundimonas sp. BT-123]|uniref:hypothetical protein n=1 Tax=Brevundimonas sp. BT-123 TaxID=2986928 RepID=UPI0022355BA5
GPLRWLGAALTGLLPTPTTPAQITKGLSLWLDEKWGSRHGKRWRLKDDGFNETHPNQPPAPSFSGDKLALD